MGKENGNIEVFDSVADAFTPTVSGLMTLGLDTVYTKTAIDHDAGKIAHGSGSTPEEAEQDALARLESGDCEDYYEDD